LNPAPGAPLIDTLGVEANGSTRAILSRMDPVVQLTVGERNLADPAGWVAFFDNPPLRAYRTFPLVLTKRSIRVASEGSRLRITLGCPASPIVPPLVGYVGLPGLRPGQRGLHGQSGENQS